LKNRGYAATCRNKKNGKNQELDVELNRLDLNAKNLTSKLDRNLERTAVLKRQNELLADMLTYKDKYEMVKEEGVIKCSSGSSKESNRRMMTTAKRTRRKEQEA